MTWQLRGNMLPTMTESNKPKRQTAFDMANARAEKELTGFDEALAIFDQKRSYAGGQLDLFPELLKPTIYLE